VININVPETGQQPHGLVFEVLYSVSDDAADLTESGAQPPQLKPSIDLARAAQERDDAKELDRQLRNIAVAAIASCVRVRCTVPDAPPAA